MSLHVVYNHADDFNSESRNQGFVIILVHLKLRISSSLFVPICLLFSGVCICFLLSKTIKYFFNTNLLRIFLMHSAFKYRLLKRKITVFVTTNHVYNSLVLLEIEWSSGRCSIELSLNLPVDVHESRNRSERNPDIVSDTQIRPSRRGKATSR